MTTNYGILVLGASVAISLFLRICGASIDQESSSYSYYRQFENDTHWFSWLTRNPEYPTQVYLRETLFANARTFGPLSDAERQMRDEFINNVSESYAESNRDSHTYGVPEESDGDNELWPVQLSSVSYKDVKTENIDRKISIVTQPGAYDDICGLRESQETPTPIEINPRPRLLNPRLTYRTQVEPPGGCHYYADSSTYKCYNSTIAAVPKLPSVLNILELDRTNIQSLNEHDFGKIQIETIRFYYNNLTFINNATFSRIEGLRTLVMTNNNMKYLSSGIYTTLNDLTMLDLSNNAINLSIYDNCPLKPVDDIKLVLPNLKLFVLKNNPLTKIPQQMFTGLRESPLSGLNLRSCALERIHEDALTYLKNLTDLFLDDNSKLMNNLPEALRKLNETGIDLRVLYLESNSMTTIPLEALEAVKSTLRILSLGKNDFKKITKDSFPLGMDRMIELNLVECKINEIEEGAFDSMPNLDTINLRDNNLKSFPAALGTIPRLIQLGLERNPTHQTPQDEFEIKPGSFDNMTGLKAMVLNQCPIKKIQLDTFRGLKGLKQLTLESCNINSIDDLAFQHLSSLTYLDLSYNSLGDGLNSLTFYGLSFVDSLVMKNCSLIISPPEPKLSPGLELGDPNEDESENTNSSAVLGNPFNPFMYLKALKTLNLEDNLITGLFKEMFQNLTEIEHLTMSRNYIRAWDSPVFDLNQNLRVIDLDNNYMLTITESMLADFSGVAAFKGSRLVDLSRNRFLCNYNICLLRKMVEEKGFRLHNQNDTSAYSCQDTVNGPSYTIFEHLPEIFCDPKAPPTQPTEGYPNPEGTEGPGSDSSQSNKTILLTAVSLSVVFLGCASAVGYRKRMHLKYFWFSFRLNVVNMTSRASLSDSETGEGEQYNFDMFLSYHQDDKWFIQDCVLPEVEGVPDADLMESGDGQRPKYKLCLHERDFEVGVTITKNIIDCVDKSRNIVIVVSKNYLDSQWCTFEMKLAYQRLLESRRKAFLIIFLESIPPESRTKVLNFLMSSRTYLEWPGESAPEHDRKRFWNRLKHCLGKTCIPTVERDTSDC